MANPYRGEAALELGGRRFTLRLTLGALAELEEAFGAQGLAALGQRFSNGQVATGDILRLLAPLLRAGGARAGVQDIAGLASPADLPAVVAAIAACFAAAMPEDDASP